MTVRHTASKRTQESNRPPHELTQGSHRRSTSVAIYLGLAALTLVVFSQTVFHDFVNYDDDVYVYNAPVIQAGLTINGIAAAFATPHAGNWHPLTTLSHMLDYRLYGVNAGGHHATNVLLHTVAVLLLFHALQRMT